jgi:hypothetical protein
VVVATGAFQRQSEKRGAESVDAVGDILIAELLLDTAAFIRLAMQAIERRRKNLFVGGVAQ